MRPGEPREPEGASGHPGSRSFPWWEVAVVTAIALAVRLIHLDALYHVDDYYHLLAAQSWLEDGNLSIAGGAPYDRASLYTYIVARFMRVLGETSWAARLPAALAGAAWVTLLFVWLRSVAGRAAAWTGALLLCFDPGAISFARLVRFYSLHSLLFLAAALGAYYLVTRRSYQGGSIAVGLSAAVALGVAYHLQVTTVIGVIALAVWLAVELGPRALRATARRPLPRIAWVVAAIGGAALLLAGVALVQSGLAAGLLGYVPERTPLGCGAAG